MILFALAASTYPEAEAEVNPRTLYAGAAPCVNYLNQPVPCAGRKKREADPQLLLNAVYPYHYPLVYGAAVKTTPCVNVKGEKVTFFINEYCIQWCNLTALYNSHTKLKLFHFLCRLIVH